MRKTLLGILCVLALIAPHLFTSSTLATTSIESTDSLTTFDPLRLKTDLPTGWTAAYTAAGDSIKLILNASTTKTAEVGIAVAEIHVDPFKADSTGFHDLAFAGYRWFGNGEQVPRTMEAHVIINDIWHRIPESAIDAAYAVPDSLWLDAAEVYDIKFRLTCGAADHASFDGPLATFKLKGLTLKAQ